MKQRFNITVFCSPQKHYMAPLDDRPKRIKEDYVDERSYFVINRGRQYGKITTLKALAKYLKDEYILYVHLQKCFLMLFQLKEKRITKIFRGICK